MSEEIKPARLPKIKRQLEVDVSATLTTMLPWLRELDAVPDDELDDTARSQLEAAGALNMLGQRIGHADLFLVTDKMTHLAVDAARDVPAGERLSDIMPSRHGVMAFSGGLPPVRDVPAFMGLVFTPSVLTWCTDARTVVFHLWAHAPSHATLREWPAFDGSSWVAVASCEAPSGDALTEGEEGESLALSWDDYAPRSVRMMSLAVSTWTLMDMPTVADTMTRTEQGAKLRSGKRDTPREVKVIDMRRLARKPPPEADEEADADTKRVFRHQWVVRGHWRQQAVGKGHAQRRATWVPSYLKGPEGAPFLPSETVFVWRR